MAVELIKGDSEERRAEVVSALTLAFARDPFSRWMYPDPHAYLTHNPAFALAFGGPAFRAGTVWAASRTHGAALWFPSGVHPDGKAIGRVIAASVEEAKLPTLGRITEKMDEFHPSEPHWYLAIIGVDAAHQGEGLGAQLMKPALARCDEEGLIAYLESSNPERHGFEAVGEIRCDDAPVLTPMLRPAA